MALESYCAACTYLSENGDYYGKFWCERKGEDRFANDSRCYSFCEAYSRSDSTRENMYDFSVGNSGTGCYLTTIISEILGYDDNNYYLNSLRGFRDNVMKKNINYMPMLLTYDMVGPMIANKLRQDKEREVIAKVMFQNYITKAVLAIEESKHKEAINIYLGMTEALAERYNINMNIVMPDLRSIDNNYLGHGKVKKLIYN